MPEQTNPMILQRPSEQAGADELRARSYFPRNYSVGKRHLFAFLTLLSLTLVSCDYSSKTLAGNPQPNGLNVLLITADDLGLQVSAYGETLIQTPNIDNLASAGVRFETAYVAAPSCSPSRASIFTGMYAHSHGHYGLTDTGLALHPELQNATIPNLLKQAGYTTGLIGKLHVNPESSFKFDYRPAVNILSVRDIALRVNNFIVSTAGQPFFLMVNYFDPHANPNTFYPQVDGLPLSPLQPSPATIFPWQQTDTLAQETRTAGYYASVQRLDAGIGFLMDVLREHNLLDKTLIIFIGDNGPGFTRAKTTLYENGIRTPFIIHWPGVTRVGEVNKALVSTVDILPTVLDAAGLPVPGHVQGESLRSALSDTAFQGRTYLVAEHHFHGKTPFIPTRAIRNGRFKLIHNIRAGSVQPVLGADGDTAYFISRQPVYGGTPVRAAFDTFANPPEFELYDLVNDPIEFYNLASDPQHQAVLQELQTALTSWRQNTNDPFLDQAVIDSYINFSLNP